MYLGRLDRISEPLRAELNRFRAEFEREQYTDALRRERWFQELAGPVQEACSPRGVVADHATKEAEPGEIDFGKGYAALAKYRREVATGVLRANQVGDDGQQEGVARHGARVGVEAGSVPAHADSIAHGELETHPSFCRDRLYCLPTWYAAATYLSQISLTQQNLRRKNRG